MNELLIAAIAIVLLFFIISKARKRINKSPEPAIQAKESKLANKPKLDAEPKKEPLPEPQAKEPLSPAKPDSKPFAESKTNATVTLPSKGNNENLPQDSMLRRHYLANLRAMIESLTPPRPTDSSLSRHYDSLIAAEIEQCMNDKGAIERLICKYEAHKKALAKQIQQHKNPKPPKDSMLSQQTNTNASAKSNMPLPPTDSVLRRHYDTMINTEINNLLSHKED
jgi:hypothetical protein